MQPNSTTSRIGTIDDDGDIEHSRIDKNTSMRLPELVISLRPHELCVNLGLVDVGGVHHPLTLVQWHNRYAPQLRRQRLPHSVLALGLLREVEEAAHCGHHLLPLACGDLVILHRDAAGRLEGLTDPLGRELPFLGAWLQGLGIRGEIKGRDCGSD